MFWLLTLEPFQIHTWELRTTHFLAFGPFMNDNKREIDAELILQYYYYGNNIHFYFFRPDWKPKNKYEYNPSESAKRTKSNSLPVIFLAVNKTKKMITKNKHTRETHLIASPSKEIWLVHVWEKTRLEKK